MSAELLPLVRRLADGQWHSGEQLAREAGLTRAGVSKRAHRLADWGLNLESRPRLGYRLAPGFEPLDTSLIRRGLRGAVCAVDVVPVTDSTNRQLLDASAQGDPQALFAEFQGAGRGRRGRAWASPYGANLYLSLAWSFGQWPADLTALPLAVGVACARALRAAGVADIRLKWPNDLVVSGKKLGGILIEHRGEAGAGCRAVIGVGINVAMTPEQAAGVAQPWTCVAAILPAAPSRNALAATLLGQLLESLTAFAGQGFAAFAADWSRLDLTRGQPVRIAAPDETFEGIARGVDASGALQVETAGQLRRVLAGDVSLRLKESRPPPAGGRRGMLAGGGVRSDGQPLPQPSPAGGAGGGGSRR